jgi:uncharacterized SAM-binding protein YcdF (DUF218 family)
VPASKDMLGLSIVRLLRQAWSGAYQVEGDVGEADCLVAFSFGGIRQGGRAEPGVSNAGLARLVRDYFTHLPKILQGEIADAYKEASRGGRIWRIDSHRRPGNYLDTYEVASQAHQIMKQQGWESALLLAQGYHIPRAAAVCRKLGLRIIVPPGLEQIPFCPHSFQEWTRSRSRWFRREIGAIIYYRFWKRWI